MKFYERITDAGVIDQVREGNPVKFVCTSPNPSETQLDTAWQKYKVDKLQYDIDLLKYANY